MASSDWRVYGAAAAIGAVAGLRSMMGPAFVTRAARTATLPLYDSPLFFLGKRISAAVFQSMAVAELVADKLPFTAARTAPPALITRAVSGGLCGAAIASARQKSIGAGALIGGLAAVGATFAGYESRKRLGEAVGVPDPVIAVLEDGLAIAAGTLALSQLDS